MLIDILYAVCHAIDTLYAICCVIDVLYVIRCAIDMTKLKLLHIRQNSFFFQSCSYKWDYYCNKTVLM